MSRPIRIQYPGALYHIMSRGNERKDIFKDKKDYQNFIEIFSDVIDQYNWQCYAYCLMPNHYHLLIKTIDPNLSMGMRQLNGRYTQKFNIKNKRFGHLFQGRYKSILVEEDIYRHQLIRYITFNPIRAKLVNNLKDWQWNSYLEVMGMKKLTGCVSAKYVLNLFNQNNDQSIENYHKYIYANEENEASIKEIKGGIILGSIKFIEEIKNHLKVQNKDIELPVRERMAYRPLLSDLFKDVTNKQERNTLMCKAHKEYNYSLSEIAKITNLHYTTISRVINRVYNE